MTHYVAFLRAINVGGRRIASADLEALFKDLGLNNASSYLASGNVVLESCEPAENLAKRIEARFDEVHGWEVPVFLRTMGEVASIAGADVFGECDGESKVYIVFGAESLEPYQPALDDLSNDVDTLVARGTEIHWLRDMEAGESRSTGDIEKELGVELTRRTVRTLERIETKFGR